MRNRRSNRTVRFLLLLFCYITIGLAAIFYITRPLLELVEAKLIMLIVSGEPKPLEKYQIEADGNQNKSNDLENGEIRKPAYGTLYGEITCERVGLTVPLYFGDDEKLLKKGAGQYIESEMPGTEGTVLIGAHDSTYFAPLENIKDGDIIQVQTDYGKYSYQVNKVKIADVGDTTAYELGQAGENLILYTCYPFGDLTSKRSDRFYVYCSKTKE